MKTNNSKKRSIAIVSSPLVIGGVEVALLQFLKQIDYSKYKITLFIRNDSGLLKIPDNLDIDIIYWEPKASKASLLNSLKKLRFIEAIKGIIYRFLTRLSNGYVKNSWYSALCFPFASYDKFDVAIAWSGINPDVVATTLYRINSSKKILWVHGDFNYTQQEIIFFNKRLSKFDKIFCVSKASEVLFNTKFSNSKNKTDVIHNSLDISRIVSLSKELSPFLQEKNTIVSVGRLSSKKGQIMVPKATKLLLDSGYDIKWYLIGDGEDRIKIEDEITTYNVEENVILLGAKSNPFPYIKNCLIYVQPSFSEGYCTTTMEAKILHKPIVTTDAPGMREQFVSGENGLIVDEMTPESLFLGIKKLIDHPELRQKFINNLLKENFDDSNELQKLYNFIES